MKGVMKKTLYKILLSASLLCAGVLSSYAADGFIDTLRYTICPGDTIRMNARQTIVYQDTILYDTLSVASPSDDSIRMYIVNLYPRFLKEEFRTIEPGTSFKWCDTTLSTGGIYERVFKTVHGCDSIYRIAVTVNYPDETSYHFKEYETICADQRFDWRGRTELNKQGIGQTTHYYDRHKTQSGQDSIYELILTVNPILRRTRTYPFCGEIRWGGLTIVKDTVIQDTVPSVTYSCDSITTTIFVKGVPFHYHDTATIVPGETLIWRGQTITVGGYYEEKHLNAAGCDSIYSIGVGMKEATPKTPMHTDRAAICEGDSYPWRNKNYREAGTYVDTLYKAGTKEVDSLYVLQLTVNPTYAISERVTFATFPQYYRGIEITGVGTYYANYTTVTGCDSIYTIYADQEILRDEENVTICEGEIFSWRGVIRTIAGQYKEVDKDAAGNVIAEHILNLTILPKRETRISAQICAGGSYTFGDRTLYETGVYSYTYHVDGCDSTVILSLNVIATDTITDVAPYNPDVPYQWARDHKLYDEPGVYYHYSTNAGGCTLTEVLILTESHVDVVDTTAIVCPSELPFVWHTIRASQSGQYQREEKQADGSYNWYRLNLTVRELKDTTVNFVVCGDVNVIYNGKTYTQAGHYDDYLGCDTVAHIHISRHPLAVYETNASLGGEHGYTWTFMRDGVSVDSTFYEPGTYEYESPNAVTGCSDLWRLILTRDETSYHFVEKMTICEGDDFSWHGLNGLSSVPGTNSYLDEHKTRTGQDSIYELILTVTPVKRSMQTQYFCGEIEWNGRTYTESTVVYDTIALSTGCYEIMRTNLELARAYKIVENWELVQGDSLFWHGQTIWGDGVFYDHYKTVHGCDSTYELHVTSIVAPEHTNMYVEQKSICKGDTLVWRGKDIWAEGRYVDTVKTGEKDSIFILNLNVWPSYKDTIVRHLYTCGANAFIRYQGQDYYQDTVIRSNLPTIHGCDSLVNVYLHFNTALYLSDTAKIADTQLPYTWTYRLSGEKRDTVLTTAGTYFHTEAAEGSCVNKEELVLVVYPTYLYEDSIIICETQLPYHWLNGPADHVNDDLEHPVGTMKQYEYRYTTVNNTDSIYRLRLTIVPAPSRVEQIYFCEGERIKVGDHEYLRIKSDSVYRDTLYKPNAGNECDSIIYYEIYQYPQKKLIETQILHLEDTIIWKGDTITSAGTYNAIPDSTDEVTGCPIIQQLRVIGEQRQTATMCILDTPYVWVHPQGNDTIYSEGLWTDTVYDEEGALLEFHTLDLKMKIPVDTLKVLRGCLPQGVTWNGITYLSDTVFRDTLLTCDTLYTIKIKVDTTYSIEVVDTICESSLPYILGRQLPDTIWSECVRYPHTDTTACGCDSTVYLTLRIIPSLTKTDSTFICQKEIERNPVTLGNLTNPWFEYRENGRYSGTWQGKWTGVHYSKDTIVYNCDSSYFHHIIVRPSQDVPFDTTYYLCEGDSVQLFWPKTEWVKRDTVYFDTVPMGYDWTDAHHGISYHRDDYLCDSVVRWTVKFVHPEQKDTTAHIVVGDSIWWGGMWRYQPGAYDSIGPAREKNSDSIPCQLTYTLHLVIDTVYHWRDTIDICAHKNTTLTHTWSDGYVQRFTVGAEDTVWRHYYDSLRTKATPNPHDSVYDLCVSYRIIRDTLLFDTICPGDSLAFDRHWFKVNDNTTKIQYLKEAGVYRDTMLAVNGCDSIITLYLAMRDRIPVAHRTVHIPDTMAPFSWLHEWTENGNPKDSTQILSATGEYRFVMPSVHGCDSIDSLSLYIHNTYRIKEDTITICQSETPYRWQDRNDITKTGDYIFHALTTEGYDSIRYVHIDVLPVIKNTILLDTICEGDSLRFGLTKLNQLRFLTKSGTYYDTLTSHQYGCDSIIELRLNVYPKYLKHKIVDIADTELPYEWKHIQGGVELGSELLNATGEYVYRFITGYGCDSIDSLSLRVHQTYIYRDTVTICSNETPYEWEGIKDIYTTGEQIKYLQTHDGYDSTLIRYIIVLPVINHTLFIDTICEGDSLRFGLTKLNQPRFLTKSGVYYDTLTSHQYGCDSIIELRLNVYPKYLKHKIVDIADTELPYEWKHIQGGVELGSELLNGTGEYVYRFTTGFGCDSIDSLSLRVHRTYLIKDDTIDLCSSETPYTWHTYTNITETKDYTFYGQTHDGYDSIHTVHINVWPVQYTTINHSMCEGGMHIFGSNKLQLTEGGTYYDTLTTMHGCDSIITLKLTVNQPYFNTRTEHIIEGNSVEFFGQTYSTSGTYTHYGKTPEGCDSTSILQLVVHPLIDTTVIVCKNDLPYLWVNKWNGQVTPLYAAGLYRNDTTYDADGTQLFYGLQLIVNEPTFDTIRYAMCEGSSYRFHGETLTQTGVYRDTVTAPNGCDSIRTLILTVNKPYFNNRTEHIIEGNSVEFYGQTYSTAGTYTHYGKTPEGCDSTSVLQVVVHPLIDTTVTVCKNDLPYLWVNKWNGQVTPLYAAGLYRNDTTYDADGTQLFYGLQLIVNEPTDTTIFRTVCADEKYDFNGRYLTQAGEYRDTLRNSIGCDSVVILHLNVLPKYYNIVERTIYEGDTVHFQNQTYSEAGIYPVRYTSSFGCDSVIELRLTVSRLYDDSVSICSNELPFLWRGKLILESGLYRDTLTDSEGRPSVIGLKVIVLPTARLEEPILKSICEGSEYLFGSRILTQPGTYFDTLTAANGCDSIVSLILQVEPRKIQTDYKTIFAGDSVEFYGEWYKESGQYEHKETNALGCEDSHILVLTVLQTFNMDTTAYVCRNDLPYLWHGYEYSGAGDFTLPITWNDTSRVTMTLHLVVNETFYCERNVAICDGDHFLFNGKEYTKNSEFYDTIPSLVGCDSIIKYIVSVHPVYDHTFEKHISDKQPYIFHDRVLTNSGTYEWTGKTAAGCDSIEHLILTVHPSFFKSDTMDLCQSDSINYPYKWVAEDGRLIASITESGVYSDSVLTEYGFDSVHQLVIYVHPSYLIREQYEIGEGEVLKIHGRDISQPAIYYDTLRTIHGCDSIFHVVVNKKRTREFTWTKEICQGEYFDFFGRKLTHTGKYVYTSQYKDSIVTLLLTVNPISITEERIVITDKQVPYIHDGRIYETSGVYADTMLNHLGCDSIHRIVLIVSSRYSEWTPMPLCPGSEIKIDGEVITEAGLYTFLRRSRVTGEMDSIFRVEVYDAPAYDMPTEVRTICDGDTIFIGGKAVTRAGHYDFALKTQEGCDSLLHLDLTVNPSYQYYQDATIRDFETYTWMGKTYSKEGNYDRTWPTILDCDSTYTLRLKVIPTQRFATIDTICEGQSIMWRGKEYDMSGYYTDTVYRPETFYSAIYTLQLTIMHPTFITHAAINDICADDDFFDIAFTYTGAKPTTYSIYFDQLAKDEGFVDIINKPFLGEDRVARASVPVKTDVIYMDHTTYVKPNKYSMRLVLDNGVCGKSQSDSLVVLVKYPSWIIEQNWNDVVAPLKKTYNGGYEFSQVSWYVNGTLQPNNGLGYMQNSHLKDGDEVVMVATRKGENYSIPTCPLVISINDNSAYDEPILVYPTKTARFAARVTIEAPQSGEYAIYSSMGASVSHGTFEQGKNVVTLPSVNGIYILRLKQGDKVETHKVIVE